MKGNQVAYLGNVNPPFTQMVSKDVRRKQAELSVTIKQ
jgi:hypothetical protein